MTLGKIRHADVPFLWPLPAEFFKSAQWALYVVRRDKPACGRGCKSPTGKEKATPS